MQVCPRTHFPRAGLFIPMVVAQMEQLGLQFGEPCRYAADHLHVELPMGWAIGYGTASGLLTVTDHKWRERIHLTPFPIGDNPNVLLVRLACFYERWGLIEPTPDGGTKVTIELRNGYQVTLLRRQWNIPYAGGSVMYHIMESRIHGQFKQWLREIYPRHEDPTAYWDE